MNYIEAEDEEYILDDGENILYIKGDFEEAKREAMKAAREKKRLITISKTVGFVEP